MGCQVAFGSVEILGLSPSRNEKQLDTPLRTSSNHENRKSEEGFLASLEMTIRTLILWELMPIFRTDPSPPFATTFAPAYRGQARD